MSITQPDLIWIGKSCFRVNPTVDKLGIKLKNPEEPKKIGAYIEEDLYGDDFQEEEMDYEIEFENGKFISEFHVPMLFLSRLIGTKGVVRKRLEHETKTKVFIPAQGQEGPVKVMGFNRDNVVSVRKRIDQIVEGARKKTSPTHFISIPLATEEIKNAMIAFKNKVLALNIPGIVDDYFIAPEQLHITFNVMALMDNQDRERASKIFEDFVEKKLKSQPDIYRNIEVVVEGLDSFNPDNLDKCRVLYAKVKSPLLQEIGNEIYKVYIKEGLSFVEHGRSDVKMHMTVMKTSSPNYFVATDIFKALSDMKFGNTTAKEIHLSQRKAYDPDTGYYKTTKSFEFEQL